MSGPSLILINKTKLFFIDLCCRFEEVGHGRTGGRLQIAARHADVGVDVGHAPVLHLHLDRKYLGK